MTEIKDLEKRIEFLEKRSKLNESRHKDHTKMLGMLLNAIKRNYKIIKLIDRNKQFNRFLGKKERE